MGYKVVSLGLQSFQLGVWHLKTRLRRFLKLEIEEPKSQKTHPDADFESLLTKGTDWPSVGIHL